MSARVTALASPAVAAPSAAGRFSFVVFCCYTLILVGRPQDYIPVLEPLRLALLLTVLSPVVTLLFHDKSEVPPLRNAESWFYIGFFLVMCAGIPFSLYRRASYEFVIWKYLANVIFFVLFVVNVTTERRLKQIVLILMLSALAFSAAGLAQGHFVDGRFFTGSQMFDPNDVPFVEIALLSFSIAVVLGGFRWISRILALTSVALGFLLSLYSGSRGGFLGLAAYILLFFLLGVARVKKTHKIVLVALMIVVAAANLQRINIARYTTLTDLQDDYNLSDEFGRQAIWRRGFQLFIANPLTGVGVACFGQAIGTMRAHESKTPYWQDPHNSFVQVLAETGIFGAVAYLGAIAASAKTFATLRRRKDFLVDSGLQAFPGLMLIGFLSLLVSAFFLSQAYAVPITLMLALSATLKRIAKQSRVVAIAQPAPVPVAWSGRAALRAGAMVR